MFRRCHLSIMAFFFLINPALAWGPEGHSIIAEIAQRRLSPTAAQLVEKLLGRGHSLASVASWADDARSERPETTNWHFVDVPIAVTQYDPARDCKKSDKGDCIVEELERLRKELRCGPDANKADALKFVVHFIGDIHQPLHTVNEAKGGNDIAVDLYMRGATCTGTCTPVHTPSNYHAAWDAGLINKVVWDWGAYVDRLEQGWLKGQDALVPGLDGGTAADWANETHQAARTVCGGCCRRTTFSATRTSGMRSPFWIVNWGSRACGSPGF